MKGLLCIVVYVCYLFAVPRKLINKICFVTGIIHRTANIKTRKQESRRHIKRRHIIIVS